MSNLENLTNKILNDCKAEAKRIVDEASAQAKDIAKRYDAEAEAEKTAILENARAEAARAAERLTLGKRLELRDRQLKAKREAIDTVFKKALDELNGMAEPAYWKYLSARMLDADAGDGVIIIPAKYKIDAAKINAFLTEKRKPAGVRIYAGKREIDGGFVLIKDGVEYNQTFEALINYRRAELEGEIVKTLF
ncbi:MAG: V-type ATP synthase subunit E [Clostridiales bacterium]|jgi:V/A-type H+-transporting ATPase subunit E|nr:V-type ATP synthase subunit E [Clostridiales bacterium]